MQDATPPSSSPPQQEQFLQVLSRDAAEAAFVAALRPRPLGLEELGLDLLLGRVLGCDIAAPVDAPPFDRAVVDGFAVRAADLFDASDVAPVRLRLNAEVIHCGTAPAGTGVSFHRVFSLSCANTRSSVGQLAWVAEPTTTSRSGSHSLNVFIGVLLSVKYSAW